MSLKLSGIRGELPPLLRLALPLIAGELGWVSMSLVDTVMLGHLPNSALAMSSAALASHLYNTLCFGVAGVLLGLDSLISQSLGANERHAANRWLVHGLLTALALAALLIGIFALAPSLLLHLPVDHAILAGAVPAMIGLNYGTLPLLLTFALRRYLQAASPRPPHRLRPHLRQPRQHRRRLAPHLSATPGHLFGHALRHTRLRRHRLLLGHQLRPPLSHGLPRLRLGAPTGISTTAATAHGLRQLSPVASSTNTFASLFLLGAPAGASIFVEISIFALVTALIATFGRLPLAGHEIALQCASTTFMVPFAISSATSVRVGHTIGRMRTGFATAAQAAAAGWSGVLAGAVFMLIMSCVLLTIPTHIARLFTPDAAVIASATPLLLIAAGFQFFDGVQVTATGALRGAGNTTAPFITQFISYWIIGMPLGIWLGFHHKLGATGLWLGLLIALAVAAVVMCLFWRNTTRSLAWLPV